MKIENAKVTLACPNCQQDVKTTVAVVRSSPRLMCAACGHRFTADLGPLIGNTEPAEDRPDE